MSIVIVREGDKELLMDGSKKPLSSLQNLPDGFINQGSSAFVGSCTVNDGKERITIYGVPKYFPEEKCTLKNLKEIKEHLRIIYKVVDKLKAEKRIKNTTYDGNQVFDPYIYKTKRRIVNLAELAEYIIDDYLQNGLYVKNITVSRKNGHGRINWGKTIARIKPVIQDDSVIYLDQISSESIIDENDLMSIIHANVVNRCIDEIGNLMPIMVEKIQTEQLDGDLSVYADYIRSRSTYVFVEREINLFKTLEAYCATTQFYKPFTGTTSFEDVWEQVNDAVWGNRRKKDAKSLSPLWFFGDDKKGIKGAGNAEPDTIRIEPESESKDKRKLYVFDSKYYVIKDFSKDSFLVGYPGNQDISKQVAYYQHIKAKYNAKGFFNVFLLPESRGIPEALMERISFVSDDEWFVNVGYVEPGEFNYDEWLETKKTDDNPDDNKVSVVIVEPKKLFEKYLKNEKASVEELKKVEIKT